MKPHATTGSSYFPAGITTTSPSSKIFVSRAPSSSSSAGTSRTLRPGAVPGRQHDAMFNPTTGAQTNANFGKVTSARTKRRMQMSLCYKFWRKEERKKKKNSNVVRRCRRAAALFLCGMYSTCNALPVARKTQTGAGSRGPPAAASSRSTLLVWHIPALNGGLCAVGRPQPHHGAGTALAPRVVAHLDRAGRNPARPSAAAFRVLARASALG